MPDPSAIQLSPCDWFQFVLAPGCIPTELVLQKVFSLYPVRLRLAAVLDCNSATVRTKVSLKEQLFNGRFRYYHDQRAVEYRKRFPLWGIACANVTARWNLSRSFTDRPLWRPQLGCGLGLGEGPDNGFPGAPLLALAGLPGRLALQQPLTLSFKTSCGSCPGLRAKAYFESSLRLPPHLSLWGEDGDYEDPYPREGKLAVQLRLVRTALVLMCGLYFAGLCASGGLIIMSLVRVEVTQEVMLAMLSHAHFTESEEIMGLLMGDIAEGASGAVCRVALAFPQIRTDRRKDRVETSPEQMARCTAHAERLSLEAGCCIRVVGWYHSHPHITVLPSHVDVRTQALYQLLDPGFVGLIVSAFNRDPAGQGCTVQLSAFQSQRADDSSPSITAAGAPLRGRGVAVVVVPSASPLERSFADMGAVQRSLVMEETEVYTRALATAAAAAGSPSNPSMQLAEAHHAAVYQAHLIRLVRTSLRPAATALAALTSQTAIQTAQLSEQVAQLERQLAEAEGAKGGARGLMRGEVGMGVGVGAG